MKKIILFLMVFILCSCKTTQKIVEVPVEVVKTEYINQMLLDSVYVHDSTFIKEKNETIYIYKDHAYIKYVNKTDTVIKVDSIPYPVTVTETIVTNKLKKWQKILMGLGGALVFSIIAYSGIKIYKLFR